MSGSPTEYSAPLRQPEKRYSAGGVLNTTLTVQSTIVELGPVSLIGRSYDGQVPGPTLIIRPGDTVNLELHNRLGVGPAQGADAFIDNAQGHDNYTNIHTHGLHVSPAGIADNIYRKCAPGETLRYRYSIPPSQPPGTFFYHPHLEGSSAVQMLSGMAGVIIVADDPVTVPAELAAMRELVAVVQEVDVPRMATIALDKRVIRNAAPGAALQFFAVNGQFQPLIEVETGEAVRLRVVHAGEWTNADSAVCALHVIARDGAYHREPRTLPGVLMSPGSRADLVITCRSSGTFRLHSADLPNEDVDRYLGGKSRVRVGTLAFVTARGPRVRREEVMPLPPTLPARALDLITADVPAERRWIFEFNQGAKVLRAGRNYTWYGVNGQAYDARVVQRSVPLGATEQWTIVNAVYGEKGLLGGDVGAPPTRDNHPFHLHVNHYQASRACIVDAAPSIYSPDWQIGDWRDTITVPAPGNVTVRWVAADFKGKSVAHCHLFSHSDTGMTANFEVV
ncbi:Cupredoxin [Tribonema minus]|uniref:Cupredoxin n=1 Tax=Tribonema minus TaxID=303371 RepID=A0A835ZAK4_9STRA|nr:Cupredoxin [Tribonema minus]